MRTKKIILLLLLSLTGVSVSAQKSYTYLGGGLSASVFEYNRLNHFIDNYNNSRTGAPGSIALTKKLDNFKLTSGFNVVWGNVNAETGLNIDLRYTQRLASSRAEAGNRFREFNMSNSSVGIGFGYTFINSGLLDVIGGVSSDFGGLYFKTRTDSLPETKYTEFTIGNSLYAQAHLTFGFIGVGARAYYMFQWFTPGLDKMDADINPNTAMALDKTLNYSSNFGVEASVFLMFGRKKMNSTNKVIRRK